MKLKIAGYIFFFLICLISALYYRFPGDLAGEVINRELSRTTSQISLEFQGLSPALPMGLAADNIVLNWHNGPVIPLGQSRISLNPLLLAGSAHRATFECHPFGGRISGSAEFGQTTQGLVIDAIFDALTLEGVNLGPAFSDCRLSSAVDGNAETRIEKRNLTGLKGDLTLARLSLELPEPLFGIRQFSFLKGQVSFLPEGKDRVRIKMGSFQGPRMDVEVSGTLQPRSSIEKTGLNLNAKLILYPQFFMDAGNAAPKNLKKGKDEMVLRVKVTGSLERPLIAMDKEGK